MTSDIFGNEAPPNWAELLARLELDLQARNSADQTLVTDEEAWQTMTKLLRTRARMLAVNYSDLQSPDFQDLVHTVLLKLQSIETMRRLRAARSIEGYLFVILRNAANDLVRRRQSEKLVPLDTLEFLDEGDLHLFQMRFWQNMSFADIATKTNSSYSATAVKLFQVLFRLRGQFADIERRIYYEELYQQLPMKTIMKDLTEDEKKLLRLHIIEQLNAEEIGDLLNKDVKLVRWEWNKLAARLRMRARNMVKKVPELP